MRAGAACADAAGARMTGVGAGAGTGALAGDAAVGLRFGRFRFGRVWARGNERKGAGTPGVEQRFKLVDEPGEGVAEQQVEQRAQDSQGAILRNGGLVGAQGLRGVLRFHGSEYKRRLTVSQHDSLNVSWFFYRTPWRAFSFGPSRSPDMTRLEFKALQINDFCGKAAQIWLCGRLPASTASMPSSARAPIASRVSTVELPMCGSRTTFSNAR